MQSKGKGLRARIRSGRVLRRVIPPLYYWMAAFGLDLANALRFALAVKNLPKAVACYAHLRRQNTKGVRAGKIRFSMPCLSDALEPSGSASGHYFHQDLLVARKVFERQPRKHVDVGSRIDGFVAHVAAFREIEV